MLRILRASAAAALALLITACAATGPRFAEVQASLPPVAAGEGRIFVFRDASAVGAALRPDVRLNGSVIGAPQPGSFFFVDRPAGRYTASARAETESTVEFELVEGESAYVSLQIAMGLLAGRPQLQLHPPATGSAALHGLAYTGSIPLVPRPSNAVAGGAAGSAPPRPSQPQGPVTMEDLRGLLPAAPGARP
jgi:hypothetical protein